MPVKRIAADRRAEILVIKSIIWFEEVFSGLVVLKVLGGSSLTECDALQGVLICVPITCCPLGKRELCVTRRPLS